MQHKSKLSILIIFILIINCQLSIVNCYAQQKSNQMVQARINRPIFTGGGLTTNRLVSTFGEPFAGNTNGSGGNLQIGAQPGVDTTGVLTSYKTAENKSYDFIFNAYPNPTNYFLNVTANSKDANQLTFQLVLNNVNGQQLKNIILKSNETKTFDLSVYAKGEYIVQIVDEKGNSLASKKIIKN
jgi:hypothetical protein